MYVVKLTNELIAKRVKSFRAIERDNSDIYECMSQLGKRTQPRRTVLLRGEDHIVLLGAVGRANARRRSSSSSSRGGASYNLFSTVLHCACVHAPAGLGGSVEYAREIVKCG